MKVAQSMRPLSRGWNKCQYLDVSWVLHACRAQSLASPQDSNVSPAWHVLYGIYDMPACRRKTLSHCFTTRTNRTRSGCLSPLSPHTLKSRKRGTSCLQAWARESRAFPTFLNREAQTSRERDICEARLREKAQEENLKQATEQETPEKT